FFLTGGTTQGLQALALSTLAPGAGVLVPETAHRSVTGAAALAAARTWYLPAALDEFWGLPRAPEPPALCPPTTQAVFLTYPDYYGLALDLAAWRRAVDRWRTAPGGQPELVLLVDEAHGAHLPFTPGPPEPALAGGADAVVQSPHKLLGSFVQSSWLHVGAGRLDPARVATALSVLATTSPSFLLLASLDATRRWAAREAKAAYVRLAELVDHVRARLGGIPGLRCLSGEEARRLGYVALDRFKLTVSVRDLGLFGSEAEAYLAGRGLRPELADPFNLLFVLSPADTAESLSALVEGLACLSAEARTPEGQARLTARRPAGAGGPEAVAALLRQVHEGPPAPAAPALPPRAMLFAPSIALPLTKAVGQVAARPVGVYPPGIPLLVPGETVSRERVELLRAFQAVGLRVDGLEGGLLHVLLDGACQGLIGGVV
ncbi:MAG: aminotransferase class I/II-fold pyridoxal phosphate-dependent enzyme, partial [Chitinophagales bacterium]